MTTKTSTYIYLHGGTETVSLTRGRLTPTGHALLKIAYSDGRTFDCFVDLAWLRDRADQLADCVLPPRAPSAITDEMHSRAVIEARRHRGTRDALHSEIANILTAALTESPARPEGAERWEDFLIDSLDYQALTDQQITDLADRIAEEMNR